MQLGEGVVIAATVQRSVLLNILQQGKVIPGIGRLKSAGLPHFGNQLGLYTKTVSNFFSYKGDQEYS